MSKKVLFTLCALMCAALVILNTQSAEAARNGFALWRDSVMPALLPFFVCTGLMRRLGLMSLSDPASLMAMAFVSGAPSGARLTGDLYSHEQDCTLIAASLNTISPMFIVGAFSSSMLIYPQAAVPIVVAQFVSMLVFYIIALKQAPLNRRHLIMRETESTAALFTSCITDAMTSLVSICGMIVFFSVFICIIEQAGLLSILIWPFGKLSEFIGSGGDMAKALVCSVIEAATGAKRIAEAAHNMRIATAVAAFSFSFGGLCIMAQSMLFMRINIKKYIPFKAAQGAFAAVIAYILFPLCSNAAQSTTAAADMLEVLEQNSLSALAVFAASTAAMGAVMLACAAKARLDRLKSHIDGSTTGV